MATKTSKFGAGREKGSTNKVKEPDVRDFLANGLEGGKRGYLYKLYDDIMSVEDPAKRAKLKMEFLEFWMPKLKAVEMKHEMSDDAGKILIAYSQAGQKALEAIVEDRPAIEGEVVEDERSLNPAENSDVTNEND